MHINFNPFPTLTTNRLYLRQLAIDDKAELVKLRSDEQVNKYLDRPATASLTGAEAFISKIDGFIKADKSIYWVISLKDDPAFIGTICLWNFVPEKNTADIGYELLPKYWGQGLMHKAITVVIQYGFDTIELQTILAVTHPDNISSATLLTKTGFKLDEEYNYLDEEETDGQAVYVLLQKQ